MDSVLRRVVVELQQHVGVVDDLRDGLRELRAVVSFERGDRRPRLVGVLGVVPPSDSSPPGLPWWERSFPPGVGAPSLIKPANRIIREGTPSPVTHRF